MLLRIFCLFLGFCCLTFPSLHVQAAGLSKSSSRFYYLGQNGRITSARVIHRYSGVIRQKGAIVHPAARLDPRLDPHLFRAVSIAEERANAHTKARCWRYVKEALVAAGAVSSYPKTAYACQAGEELVRDFGFQKLAIRDPYLAPIGAVIVYGRGSRGAGHVELRTKNGFVSDYRSRLRCYYPVLAVYGKFSS